MSAADVEDDYAILTEGLTKVFPGDVRAVDGLDLKIRRGEVFGFLGPNGAGKTTSIRMMTGLLKPTSGKVTIEGELIDEVTGESKKRIGVCPQEIVMWNLLTSIENLTLIASMYNVPRKLGRERAEGLLEELQLTEKKDAQAGNLSGGMKRRLNVAMAMIHDPDIIVLDEPTAGLDPQSRLVVTGLIDRIKREEKKTIILTTHMMEIADQLSDRVAIIDHGKLLQLDTPENLKNQIGAGDVMDIALVDESHIQPAIENLGRLQGVETSELRGRVLVKALDVAKRLPEIFQALDSMGAKVSDVSLRRNTLEDVFIALTGRKLRE
jgi:ABC-2 type transport system ATP-binding protein